MIPRRRKREPMGVRAVERIRCHAHLSWVRGCLCVADRSGECNGRMEAHHVREGQNAGIGQKPDDSETVPACARHHAEGHTIGWQSFEKKYAVDLSKIAAAMWRRSPARIRYERKMEKAR